MKKLLAIVLLLGFACPMHANNPNETLLELARIGHSASPTEGQEDQVLHWYKDAQQESANALYHAFLFAQCIMPPLFEARDSEILIEATKNVSARQEMLAMRRAWVRSQSALLDQLVEHLTSISTWAHSCILDQTNAMGLQELDAWIEQFNERQRDFRLDYDRCVTPQTPGLGTESAPRTSPEPEALPSPPKLSRRITGNGLRTVKPRFKKRA